MLALEVSPNMDLKKQKCYEELGFLVQLIDDFEDRAVDVKDGIITLANSLEKPEMVGEIIKQAQKVKKMFESQYEAYKLSEIFKFIDQLLASAGILK
ncbi:MAG: hypothetical protein M3M85_01045 [bacterium]|nr:hypothetical protein [bacterium]